MKKKKTKRDPWQKTLYGNKGYPDNYTDPLFLKDLQKNINVEIFTYHEAVLGATKLSHQISLVITFLLVFHNLYEEPHSLQPEWVLLIACVSTIIGYIPYFIFANRSDVSLLRVIVDDSKTVISVLFFGFILSPMLHTLTRSIDTDTIFTVTFFVFLLHLICFDYGLPASIVSNAISLNAVVFGALCLASRLSTSFHAFVLLVTAVELFALYPKVFEAFNGSAATSVKLLPVIIVSLCNAFCLLTISSTLFSIYFIGLVFITFIYPCIFCYVQKYKNNIHGPWDEAVVDVSVNKIINHWLS